MKKITLLGLFLFISQLFFGQTVTIPDANFKASLVNNSSINTNGDTEIQVSEAEAYSGSLYYYGNTTITDVTGIEAFTSVTSVDFANASNLTGTMNLSNNTSLSSLRVVNTLLENIDVSGCTGLITLKCYQNNLTTLNTTDCTTLEELNCGNNNLTSLDISTNTQLTSLSCGSNSLVNLDISSNAQLTYLNCGSNSLANLDISSNAQLTYLDCGNNSLASLNVYTNTQLTNLSCDHNNFTSLDITNNTQLTSLNCGYNNFTSLDISTNTQLTSLNCRNNNLDSLDVTNNLQLTYLSCSNNPLYNINVTNNTQLTYLNCSSTHLSTLDVSANTQLTTLWCIFNQLTELDLSDNSLLTFLYCHTNNLNSLNVQNGNNNNITNFSTSNNPHLTCIYVDDSSYSTTNWTSIDANSIFVETQAECEAQTPTTYVPDDNFEQVLIDLGYDDILDDYVITAYINTIQSLSISSKNILDLTGIEGFVQLSYLNCSNNNLTSLDTNNNTQLTRLYCNDNLLTNLNISNNTQLTRLYCYGNQLTNLDASNNTQLTHLYCYDNPFTNLDVSNNTQLTYLDCHNNTLTNLDINNNTQLTHLYCQNNTLTNLDVTNNMQLTNLNCYNTQLTNLDISNNTQLTNLNCLSNQLTTLDVSHNTLLTSLDCFNNQLTALDVSHNTQLFNLHCANNNITSLDLTNNTQLVYVTCHFNQLTSIDLRNGNNTIITSFSANNNPDLTCIFVDDANYSTTNWGTSYSFVETQTECDIANDIEAPIPDLTNLLDITDECEIALLTPPTATDNLSGTITATTTITLPITTQGTTVLTWTYDDGNGNTSTQTQNVIIEDVTAPVANTSSLTNITAECEITSLTAPMATDNCSGAITATTTTTLPIITQGTTVVTWTYDDGNGNTSTQTQNVIIEDVTAPIANLSTLADITNECEISTLMVPTATDNCIGSVTATTTTTLPITIQGTTVVIWTYDDGNGNTSTQIQNVIIDDITAPVADITTLTDITSECDVTILTPPTATDNCVGSVRGTTNVTLPVTTQGTTVVTWTYDDGNGNTSTQTQNVIIEDVTEPIADVNSLTDITAECEITALTPPTATDSCAGTINATTTTTLPITTQGTTIITWTYDDGKGNTSTQTQHVIIDDVIAPTVITQNITVDLAGVSLVSITPSQIDNDSTDNCTINTMTLDIDTFTEIGEYTVMLTIEDANTNSSSDTAIVTVIDSLATTYVPDDNFEQALINLGYDDILDDHVFTSNINTVAYLNLDNKNITDLTGIEDFTELLYLWCNVNSITSLDLSQNTNLVSLKCNQNQLASLDVSNSDSLTTLECYLNQLTSLDVTNNTTLTNLSCSSNQLSSLDVSQNILLTSLSCSGNQLSTLDVTQNTDLTYLGCAFNQLTSLDVTQNADLSTLDCASNQLTLLDVSRNILLDGLECRSNQLIELDVSQNTVLTELYCNSNDLISLDLRNGNNTNMSSNYSFYATYNPTLTCIYVDDVAWSNTNWTHIDSASTFVETEAECNLLDHVAPVADITTLSDVISECEVTVLTPPTATDNLSGTIIGATDVSLPIISQGTTVITWTYLDGNGNTSTQTQNVIIEDVTAPVADTSSLTNITAECEITALTAPMATDNCVGVITATTTTILPIITQGTTIVTWTYDDGNGNTSTQTQNVIIEDVTVPVVITQNITVDLAGNSSVSITPNQIDNGSTDNCTIDIMTLDIDTFTATGDYTVSLTAEDANGNSNSENAVVTVIDTTASIYTPEKVSFMVYPNPTNSIININSNFRISKIKIYNEFGQLLLINTNKNSIDISKLAQGVYFVKIEDIKFNHTMQKIIKK